MMDILVFGATGNTGSLIVNQLKEKNADFGVAITQTDSAADLDLEADQVRIATYDDQASLTAAMAGVSTIYFLMPIKPDMVTWTQNVIAAAKDAGVKRIVKQSGLTPRIDATSDLIRDHAETDQMIVDSGIDYTILGSNTFFQAFYGNLPSIQAEGAFYAPLGDKAFSNVDINDFAEVAAEVLTNEGHSRKTYALTGPAALTSAEHAKIVSAAVGKEINYVNVPKDAFEQALSGAGFDAWTAKTFADAFDWFATADYETVTNDVETILGRPANSFDNFAQEFAQAVNS